jgi:hypothetical protein
MSGRSADLTPRCWSTLHTNGAVCSKNSRKIAADQDGALLEHACRATTPLTSEMATVKDVLNHDEAA